MPDSRLEEMLAADEGLRLKVYTDTLGVLTIGYGRNLEARGLRHSEARMMLRNDCIDARSTAIAVFPWFLGLSMPRQDVVCAMIFQLGRDGFMKFHKTIDAMIAGDFTRAAIEMLDSLWAKQTPSRARRYAEIMRTGEWPQSFVI